MLWSVFSFKILELSRFCTVAILNGDVRNEKLRVSLQSQSVENEKKKLEVFYYILILYLLDKWDNDQFIKNMIYNNDLQ